MKKLTLAALAGLLIAGSVAFAQFEGHPHLKAAQQHIGEALQQLREAQHATKAEFGGHRDRAEALLNQADREIVAAAKFANTHPISKNQPPVP
ncbi:MAG: hypothetical protein WA005_13790 [Candidatus Binataceae bacterium]